jgi:hypothetical protein
MDISVNAELHAYTLMNRSANPGAMENAARMINTRSSSRNIPVMESQRKRPVAISRRRWEYNIKMITR